MLLLARERLEEGLRHRHAHEVHQRKRAVDEGAVDSDLGGR
jgi:hypothetical protein